MTELDVLEITRRRRQWRWKYKAAGNFKLLAEGGESYHNLDDLLDSAQRVLNLKPIDRSSSYQRVSRDGGWPDILVVMAQ
jgi:hypothetical protein